ncbi:MAG: hypothetical protein K0Q90_3166 [Paenibacillaceae bacterium]|nr:hypothetical protein [Paenibacillaceae bacterium]
MSMFVLYGKDAVVGMLPLYLQIPSGERLPPGKSPRAVLQWGVPAQDAQALFLLNPLKGLIRAVHSRTCREFWRQNGMKVPVGNEKWVYEFQVAVFQLDALAIWTKAGIAALVPAGGSLRANRSGRQLPVPVSGGRGGWRELPPEEQEAYHIRRAKRDAVRAVYALGLSTGLVRVGVNREGNTMLIGVEACPVLDDRLAELFAGAINRYAEKLEAAERTEAVWQAGAAWPTGVRLGADPEFVLRRPGGSFVPANRFLEKSGVVGCDAVVLSRDRVIHPLAELRPKPCGTPRELVRELYRTMRQAARQIPDASLAWLSGSMPGKGLSTGGHVHVSGVWLHDHLLRALDNYAALPLVLAEGEAAGQRRPKYGFLGDARRKRHGGFEYRTLPSWLSTPELALAVLTLVHMIALHYRELRQTPLDHLDIQRAYYNGDKKQLLPVVRKLWTDLERLPAYRQSKETMDAFRDRLFRMEEWNEQADFRIPWKIPPYQEKAATSPAFML